MRKNSQLKKSPPKSTRPFPWLWLVGGGAVLLIVAGLALGWSGSNSQPAAVPQTRSKPVDAPQAGSKPVATPQTKNKPQLVVDRTLVDDGYVKFNTPVHVSFKLSNQGSQPLQILDEPKVELIEGCWSPQAVVSSTTIQSGQEAELTLDYMMHEGMGGPHEFHVRLRTNDPVEPETVLIAKSNWGP